MTMPTKVYLLFDERMTLHRPQLSTNETSSESDSDDALPDCENPNRILAIFQKLMGLEGRLLQNDPILDYTSAITEYNKGLDLFQDEYHHADSNRRFIPLACHPADRETIELVHSRRHYDNMQETCMLSDEELKKLTVPHELYFCRDTFLAASLACGGVVECVNAVTMGRRITDPWYKSGTTRAIAVVRPPGHHALRDEAMGFCYFNNLAVAAKHALHTKRAKRVFILDWDIHHGNGTQDLTYDDPNIFYLSIHRRSSCQKSWFYPGTGHHDEIGDAEEGATGTNLNIVWGQRGMGNVEYAAAFSELVLPVLSSFHPDLILIGSGLDAAQGDLLGDCNLTPEMYYIMTKSVLQTAGVHTPVVVALEGGYNLDVISTCMEAVALALLDEPWKDAGLDDDEKSCCSTSLLESSEKELMLRNSQFNLSRYWNRFRKDRKKRTTKHAISSIQKSAGALANNGTCLGAFHFLVRKRCREEEVSRGYRRLALLEYNRYPVKKRRPDNLQYDPPPLSLVE